MEIFSILTAVIFMIPVYPGYNWQSQAEVQGVKARVSRH
jgi:hypothetical protein